MKLLTYEVRTDSPPRIHRILATRAFVTKNGTLKFFVWWRESAAFADGAWQWFGEGKDTKPIENRRS